MGDEIVEMPIVYGATPTVAAQQCGREPDAYEVRCTDGNYEWRRPYHGELEVIMRTGRDRSGKPFEYRALYAAVSPLSTVTPAEVGGLVERLREGTFGSDITKTDAYLNGLMREAATALEAQAAELAAATRRAERAEAKLAEARKALVIANAQLDNMEFLSVEGFMDWQQEYRVARRGREAQGGENNG